MVWKERSNGQPRCGECEPPEGWIINNLLSFLAYPIGRWPHPKPINLISYAKLGFISETLNTPGLFSIQITPKVKPCGRTNHTVLRRDAALSDPERAPDRARWGGVFSVSRFYHAANFGLGTFLTSVVGPLYFLLLLLVPNKTGAARDYCLFLFMAAGVNPKRIHR
jgi:hypothetical protein